VNKHVASVVPFRRPLEALDRDEIIKSMAEHLVAAILHDRLDTSSDIDVIDCLLHTPERFQSRVVLNHMDDALVEAKQTLIAMEMSQ
jgi:hypothetical protein